jgi:hypothetical protein
MKHLFYYMAAAAMLVSACNSGEDKTIEVQKESGYAGIARNQDQGNSEGAVSDTTQTPAYYPSGISNSSSSTREDWDKKIIKIAEVTLELKDYTAYNQKFHTGLKAYGAYIAAEEQTTSSEKMANELTIKVPVEEFDNLMNAFAGDGIKVLQKKVSTDDVTGKIVDTKSRIEARKQVRDRYLQLLRQARNMKEILEVQTEINSVQEDIESAVGRVGYLTHQASFSTIHLQYFQVLDGVVVEKPSGFLVQVKDGFNIGIKAIGYLIVLLVSIWPLLLGIAFVLLWLRRKKQPAGGS